eukprot:CAMPEP_0175254744 /NCGR_PEP_ID=MMETSP0093-20121207/37346_1 /TAXON_ID=311494 /ORGANISM="Alexandrium monilatum, Strain CCMP3105" /LENGTH=45 /DNA_ID= /DNA_START= /DNA_END= /DNA_ORIENTATION=
MTSPWEGPFLMPRASSTPRVYSTSTLATAESDGTGSVPKYTKLAP